MSLDVVHREHRWGTRSNPFLTLLVRRAPLSRHTTLTSRAPFERVFLVRSQERERRNKVDAPETAPSLRVI